MPAFPAAFVKFISPSGWPSRANAAGAMKMGKLTGMPSIVELRSVPEIRLRIRGRNHQRLKEAEFARMVYSSSPAER
jgi:hypothetical protein